jgi:hypothetical protein
LISYGCGNHNKKTVERKKQTILVPLNNLHCILYIFFYRNLQFLIHANIIKAKVPLLQAYVTLSDFGILPRSFGFLSKEIYVILLSHFWLWAYPMMVIQETCHLHYIWYLYFYYRSLYIVQRTASVLQWLASWPRVW